MGSDFDYLVNGILSVAKHLEFFISLSRFKTRKVFSCINKQSSFLTNKKLVLSLAVFTTFFVGSVLRFHFCHDRCVNRVVLTDVTLSPQLRLHFVSWRRQLFDSGSVDQKGSVQDCKFVSQQTQFVHLSHFILKNKHFRLNRNRCF